MTDPLLIALIALAALACPIHMWWMTRRERRSACCGPKKTQQPAREPAALRARCAEIEAQLTEFDRDGGATGSPRSR